MSLDDAMQIRYDQYDDAVRADMADLKGRAIVAAEYRLHCSPHEWTDDDSEAMARYIIALHGPAISRMPTATPTPSEKGEKL